jgi:hypothetical protein
MKAEKFTVTTTAASVADGHGTNISQARTVVIRNMDAATTTVWVGGSDVDTDANGFPLDSDFPATSIDFAPGESLYAVTASGTATLRVFRNQI